jgi:hypothetical protein
MFKKNFLLVIGLLSLLLVAMAVSRPAAKAPTAAELSWPPRPVVVDLSIQRGRVADSARLSGIAESYIPRGLMADSLRWSGIAGTYQNAEKAALQLGRTADALRWTAIAKHHVQLNFQSRRYIFHALKYQ